MEIKDYKSGDEVAILELFQLSFGRQLSLDFWKWRFLSNPVKKLMIKLMWDKDKLVGHYAVSPVTLSIGQENILSALSMTTMTHPEYAGRGIFKDLAEALYNQEANTSNLKAVWGFPNANSHYGFIKNLKWKNLEQIPTFTLDCAKLKSIDFSSIKVVGEFGNEHVVSQIKSYSSDSIKVNKSLEYLNWRYLQNPVNKYDIFEVTLGSETYFAVAKVFSSFIDKNKYEVDLLELSFPADHDLLLQLLNAIKVYYASNNICRINLWLSLHDDKHILLEKIGFANMLPITYSGIRILDDKLESLATAANWSYSMGDSDVY
ncbi:MAG: GNAT family N-acetyltransferase [Bacteroidetes bacterium]|nr:GNAT family N-acetyltransferase [Bacteroidota bacterium]